MTEQKFSSVGLFSGKVMWNYLSQTPQRRSRLAFVFSGQGSMFPGMAKKFQNEPIFLSFCRRAEQFLYRKKLPILSDYLFYKRRLPLEQQEVLEVYALFTFEVAASFLLIEAGFAPSVLTGHSFGEYAALVLAGSLSFENGLECVFQRESVLPARNKAGYMLAVALPEKKLRAIFEGTELYFAVKNSADQMVLSLDWWSLIQVETLLKERKVRFKRLNSSQPFHSPLLSASVHELSRKNLSNISITRPIWPVFSGVTKSWLNDDEKAEEKVKAALTNQLIEPVDFVKQVEAVSERVDHFVEISPIALLSPFIKRNAPDKKVTFGLELIPDIEESIHAPSIAIQPSILERLNSVIARVTGYSVEDIRLEKKFQEDLGIDSIKTMELSIEVMSEFCIPRDQVVFSRNIKTVGDLALMVQRRFESETVLSSQPSKRDFHAFQENWTFSSGIQNRDSTSEQLFNWTFWSPSSGWSEPALSDEASILVIEIVDEIESIDDRYVELLVGFVEKIQSWIRTGEIDRNLSIVLIGRQENSPWLRGFSGFFKALKKEGEIAFFCQIQVLDPELSQSALEQRVKRDVVLGRDVDIRYFESQRFVGSLEPVQSPAEVKLPKGKAWVIGGAKGIAFELLKQLSKDTFWELLLLGRASKEEVIHRIQALENQGLNCRYISIDFTDSKKVTKLAREEIKEIGSLGLLLQSAGIQLSKKLRDKSKNEITEELEAKIETTLNCLGHQIITADTTAQLMSSVIARFGNHGQSIYALASGFSEALWYQHVWIQWPPWNQVGMTQSEVVSGVLEAAGVSLIEPKEAFLFFKQSIEQGNTVVLGEGDLFLYQIPLMNFRDLGIAIDQVLPQRGLVVVSFQMNDFLIKQCRDHSIKNQPVVPLSWIAQWVFNWGKLIKGEEVILKTIAVYRFLQVTSENQDLHCEIAQQNIDGCHLKFTLKDKQGLIAEANIESKGESIVMAVPNLTGADETDEFFNLYSADRLFHGPKFQFLKELKIWKSGESAKAKIHLPLDSEDLSNKNWNFYQLVDAALQTLGAYILEKDNQRAIPVVIENLSYQTTKHHTRELFCELTQIKKEDAVVEAKLEIFNEKNELLCQLGRAKFRVTNPHLY